MKELLHILKDNNLIYKSLEELNKKEIGTRSKIDFYKATDRNGYYSIIFYIEKKSRILQKDVQTFEKLIEQISTHVEHNFKFKIAYINAPLCSKAKALMIDKGWKILH